MLFGHELSQVDQDNLSGSGKENRQTADCFIGRCHRKAAWLKISRRHVPYWLPTTGIPGCTEKAMEKTQSWGLPIVTHTQRPRQAPSAEEKLRGELTWVKSEAGFPFCSLRHVMICCGLFGRDIRDELRKVSHNRGTSSNFPIFVLVVRWKQSTLACPCRETVNFGHGSMENRGLRVGFCADGAKRQSVKSLMLNSPPAMNEIRGCGFKGTPRFPLDVSRFEMGYAMKCIYHTHRMGHEDGMSSANRPFGCHSRFWWIEGWVGRVTPNRWLTTRSKPPAQTIKLGGS